MLKIFVVLPLPLGVLSDVYKNLSGVSVFQCIHMTYAT